MVNKVMLIGRVGADPEIRALENGKVGRLRLATSERYFDKNANQTVEFTEWHTISVFDAVADVVDKYVKKGQLLYIEGKLRTRKWTEKNNIERYTTEIFCYTLKMLDKPQQATGQSAQPAPAQEQAMPVPPADGEDDLPF